MNRSHDKEQALHQVAVMSEISVGMVVFSSVSESEHGHALNYMLLSLMS